MPSVTIDPGVIAAPPPEVKRAAVYEYIDTLLDWSKLLDEPWVAIRMSENAADVLFEDGRYPLREGLAKLFDVHGVEEYSVNDIALIADKLLQQTPYFETYFRLRDVLYEQPSTEPDLLSIATHEHMASELARCVILFALLRKYCRESLAAHALVVRPWHGQTLVHVRALIHELEHERDDLVLPPFPFMFEGDVWVCCSFRELVTGIDETAVWRAACVEEGAKIAVNIALYKMRLERGLDPEWGEGSKWRFGGKFLNRSTECFRNNSDNLIQRTLRAIVETIDGQQLQDVHALRQGNSGGAPQRQRAQDKAWRRDIDREYHIHYWECGDGAIEFGWMGPHNDFNLPE